MDDPRPRARIGTMTRPPEVKSLEGDIEEIKTKKERAIKNQDFEGAAAMRDKEKQAKEKLESVLKEWRTTREEKRVKVDEEDIMHVVSKWTGIPLQRMEQGEMQRLLQVELEMTKVVIGQKEAVSALSKALRRSRADLKDPRRPIGTFALLGPTGVGKTLLAKTLAEQLFGDPKALIQLDMSEYMEKFNVSRLIGSPPGYVGYEEGGQLTEQVRRKPYSVVLFDAVEKAHPDGFNALLQVLGEGRLTDGQGRTVDFRNTVLVMTSNLGSQMIQQMAGSDYQVIKLAVMGEVKTQFRPEFVNRIDEIVVFHALGEEHIKSIARIQLEVLKQRLAKMDYGLEISDAALGELAKVGFAPVYGARPLKRAIQSEIENPLAKAILEGRFAPKDVIAVDYRGGKTTFEKKKSVKAAA